MPIVSVSPPLAVVVEDEVVVLLEPVVLPPLSDEPEALSPRPSDPPPLPAGSSLSAQANAPTVSRAKRNFRGLEFMLVMVVWSSAGTVQAGIPQTPTFS
jgi:hypothetical protein